MLGRAKNHLIKHHMDDAILIFEQWLVDYKIKKHHLILVIYKAL